MKTLNLHTPNIHGLNVRGLNVDAQMGQSAFGGYASTGLIFQLDCKKGIASGSSTWTDLIRKIVCEGTSAFTIDDGVVFDGTNTFAMPTTLGSNLKVEICSKASTAEESSTAVTAELPTALGSGFTGWIYSVRVYDSDKYTESICTKNAAIDNARFNVPASALWLGEDDTIMLGDDYLCLE